MLHDGEIGGIDKNLAVAKLIDDDPIDGHAGSFGLKIKLVGGLRRVGHANGRAPAEQKNQEKGKTGPHHRPAQNTEYPANMEWGKVNVKVGGFKGLKPNHRRTLDVDRPRTLAKNRS